MLERVGSCDHQGGVCNSLGTVAVPKGAPVRAIPTPKMQRRRQMEEKQGVDGTGNLG